MRRDHLVIDSDGHVMEPFSLWQEYLAPELRQYAYRTVVVDGEPKLAMGDLVIDMDIAPGDFASPGGLRAGEARGRGWDEIHPAASEPGPRLALMDDMGIDVAVLYPTFLLGAQALPDGFREPVVDAYERWIVDFCAADPRRLKWAAVAPRNSPREGAETVARAAGRGASAIFVSSAPTPDGRLVGDPAEDVIAAAIIDAGLPLGVHVSDTWSSTHDFRRLIPSRWMWDVLSGPTEIMLSMVHVFGNGLLDRFPDLRVAFLEGNLGWFPWLIHKMAESYENFGSLFPMPDATPLEQFRRQCWISGETGEAELAAVSRLVGPDRCLWASDYPHYEASWTPVEELTGRADIGDAEARAMLLDAPMAFYGFSASDLPDGPTSADGPR